MSDSPRSAPPSSTPSERPGHDAEDARARLEAWTALALADGLGPVRTGRAWAACGRDVLRLAQCVAGPRPERLENDISADVWGRLRGALTPARREEARLRLRAWGRVGPSPVHPEHPSYPPLLAEIADPPPLLFVRGAWPRGVVAGPEASRVVAVVGTRKASPWALAFTRTLAADLARAGVCVVSGLALGVDAAAHAGALEVAPDATIAVLGSSLDRLHPARHAALAERIARHGALVSEHPPGTDAFPGSFPPRNRLIAGLARAVVVVEAAAKSGVTHTVRFATDQGRDVYVVPQRPDGPKGRYAAALLTDGAAPFVDADGLVAAVKDLAEAAAPHATGGRRSGATRPVPDDPRARTVLARLADGEARPLDALMNHGDRPGQVLASLTQLELAGLVRPDGRGGWRKT